MWHLLIHRHWFKPHVVSQDRFYFDEYDGCEKCMKRITFVQAIKVSPNIITGVLLHFGVICSPTYHVLGKCNKKGHFDE